MLSRVVLLTVLLVAAVAGCTRSSTVAAKAAPPVAMGQRWLVYGVDTTLSYALTQQALDQAAGQVHHDARPGDVWFFRQIDNRSYSDRAAILTLHCPVSRQEPFNPFADLRSRARAVARRQAFARLKETVARQLEQFRSTQAIGTDIYGALTKAGELLGDAPLGAEKILVLATDLGDTLHRSCTVNLRGVSVFILFQGGGNPERAQQRRREWTARLQRYGASRITWRDPSQGITDDWLGTAVARGEQ